MNKYQWPNGSTSEFNSGNLRPLPRRSENIFAFDPDIVNFLLKTKVGKPRRPNFVIFVV